MKSGLDVYDFKEEDELAEAAAAKYLSKFKNPNPSGASNILKHQFLECVAQGSVGPKKEIGCLPCVDVDGNESDLNSIPKKDGSSPCVNGDAIETDDRCNDATSDSLEKGREEFAAKEENPGLDIPRLSISLSHEHNHSPNVGNCETKSSVAELDSRFSCHEAASPQRTQLNFNLSASPSTTEPAADESVYESHPSSPNIAEDVVLDAHTSSDDCGDSEMNEIKIAADYIVYRNNYCPGCLVTFSSNGIKINGFACGDEDIFSFEKEIDDMIRIESQILQRFDTVIMKFQMFSKDDAEVDIHDTSECIEELEILVVEPNWSRRWEEISSLNAKYLALWRVVHDADVAVDGGSEFIHQRPYFPDFDEPFEEIVYPKGDIDAVSISKSDVDLLQPETFINDTIIDFYIKYLKNQIPAEEKHRFHFFNSFFFRKLADMDKDPSSASDGRAAFLRVQKWTRKVDIFGKDYVFIPVNFNLHWSLLIICHPGEVAGMTDEDSKKSLRVPCILHMDSIKGTHAGLKNLVQSYLWEEWKERHKDASEELSAKFLNLWFVSLELPQQENSFDCGLFLLHYLELFLVDAPLNFSPFTIDEFSKFLNTDWFPPAEASLKRTLIQRLISDLLDKRSREASSSAEPESRCQGKVEKQSEPNFVSEKCPSTLSHMNLPNSEAGHGIEITLLEAASLRNSQSLHDPLVLRDLLEPGVSATSLLAQCSSLEQPSYYRLNGAMSQMQDDAETGEQFVYFPGETGFQQMNAMAPEGSSIPYSFRGFGADVSWNTGISVHDGNSSEISSSSSDDSEVGIIEKCTTEADSSLFLKEEADEQRPTSTENMECLTKGAASASRKMVETRAVEDAEDFEGVEDPDKIHLSDDNCNLALSRENPTTPSGEDVGELIATEDKDKMHNFEENGDLLPCGQENPTTSPLEGAKDMDNMHDDNNDNNHPTSCQENPTTSLHQDSTVVGNGPLKNLEKADIVRDDDIGTMDNELSTDLSEQPAKRLRLTPPLETQEACQNICLGQGIEL
ncbi:hypothetical protein Tsubulata_001914 [Turnera subulata]|uniref:Ubiquitin-like protease family profile domain-containing protein n=1 Tax=Turnera subulata TaxID=218843 RepID=A0A9Q0FJU2_9ROSI|nr:hypothetical protein Tsubulata_001914 [Turnera subulata]